jgi:adenosylcobinamide-GDP ribazoletransferase
MVRAGSRVSGFLGAVQFLTRIPVRTRAAVPHDRVLPWLPFVGALIGVLVGGVAAGLAELVPTSVAAAIAVVVALLITGAFHEDGLADVADAFGGGTTHARRFEILKDPRHGTYGVAALCGSVVLRVVGAASIASSSGLFAAFVAAHALGRTGAVATMAVVPAAREAGLGADHARRLRPTATTVGIAAALAIVAVVTGWWTGPLLAATAVCAGAVALLAMRKIGGLTGDVLGAIEQVVECLVIVTVSGLAARHALWWA